MKPPFDPPLRRAPELLLPVPVLIVEDEPVFQLRLREVLLQLGYTSDVLIVADTLAKAYEQVESQPFALALVDLALPDGNGQTLISALRAQDPGLGILVVTAWSAEDDILGALRAGATGYVLKERDDFEVMLSIRSVLRGGAPIDPFIARRILQLLPDTALPPNSASERTIVSAPPSHAPGETLSKREREILRQVANGMSNREIAERLFLSHYTVETHVKRIYRKLAVSSRAMAVRTAMARGELE